MRYLAILLSLALFVACNEGDVSPDETPADAHDHERVHETASDDTQQWTCGMHPQIVEDEPGFCPICGMELTPMNGAADDVVEITPVTLQNMGVRTTRVEVAPLGREVRTTGYFEANEQATRAVSPKISGWVERLHVNYEGQRVRRGQPLMEIYSPELVSTQEEYLLALRNAERLRETDSAEDAHRLVEAAERRLAYWDISEEQIQRLRDTGVPQKTLTLYAPAPGTVEHKRVVEGQQVRAGETLMQLTDLRELWLMVDLYERDLDWIETGTEVVIELPYSPGARTRGQIDRIYDRLDRETRTARARVRVPNPQGALRPGMYATALVSGRQMEALPVIPDEAVIFTGRRGVVILALGEGRFRPVEVETGMESGGLVQILSGLEGDEEVVTSAQFMIDSEARLRSAVGAMSGHDHGNVDATATSADDEVKAMLVDVYAADENGDGMVYQCTQQPHLLGAAEDQVSGCQSALQHVPIGLAQTVLHDTGYQNVPVDPARIDTSGTGRIFQSPMHQAYMQDTDGSCAVCGMHLEEVTLEEARANLRAAGYRIVE